MAHGPCGPPIAISEIWTSTSMILLCLAWEAEGLNGIAGIAGEAGLTWAQSLQDMLQDT